jgi:hypothetical protein
MIRQLPAPTSGGLILSYKCSAACKHCMYACSPKWPADWITEADLESMLAQLAETIQPSPHGPEAIGVNDGLHFTGGEPFLNFRLLCRAAEIARDLGIPSTFVETNAAWCINDQITREKLRLLKDKGLKGILISVNPYFLEYVPFERTECCIRNSLEIFRPNVIVYQLEYYKRFKNWGFTGTVSLEEYFWKEKQEDFARNVEFFLMGRAPYALRGRLQEHFPRYPASVLVGLACQLPFLRPWHNHFDNYGNYVPGFCAGVSLGDCRHLDRLLREGVSTEDRPVLKFLMEEDLGGLLRFARERGYEEAKGGYFSSCHLCVDLRRHLAASGRFAELNPAEFYQHLEEAEPPRVTTH